MADHDEHTGDTPLGRILLRNARLALAHERGEYTPPKVKHVAVPADAAGEVDDIPTTRRYTIVIERHDGRLAAHAPDVPGVIVVGASVEEVSERLREELTAHLAALAAAGEPLPTSATRSATIDVPLPLGAR